MGFGYSDAIRVSAALNGTATTFNPADDFNTSVLGAGAVFSGIGLAGQGGMWLWKNHGNYGHAFKNLFVNPTPAALRAKGSWFTNPFTNKYYWNTLQELNGSIAEKPIWNQKAFDALKTEAEKSAFKNNHAQAYKKGFKYQAARLEFERIKELAKRGKLHGKDLKNALKNLKKMIYKADLEVLEDIKAGKLKPTGTFSKIGRAISKYTGIDAANRACLRGLTTEGTTTAAKAARFAGKAGRTFIKGGGPLAFAIEMGLEIPDIIKTYNKLGAGKGTKQLAKSTAVVGASTIGFVAGAKAGAALGTTIGACFGGIGAIPGAIIGTTLGIIGGLAGSWACRYGAKKLVGPSELEKANNLKRNQDAFSMLFDKDKQLEACADITLQAQMNNTKIDDYTFASIEKALKGREEEFAAILNSKIESLQNKEKTNGENLSLTA